MNDQSSNRRKLAKGLIWMGVLAWAPYILLKYIIGGEVVMLPFLVVHLTGVLGGGYLKTSELIKKRNEKPS